MADGLDIDAEETIVGAFLAAHAREFPGEEDKRENLRRKTDALLDDARRLLRTGIAVATLCEIIRRDMGRVRSLGHISPVTIRFCARSVESASKVGTRAAGSGDADPSVRRSLTAADFSVSDYRAVCGGGEAGGYSRLLPAERWRWHAYMRAWRRLRGFDGPPPFDQTGKWAAPELDALAWPVICSAFGQRSARAA